MYDHGDRFTMLPQLLDGSLDLIESAVRQAVSVLAVL